MRTLVQGFGQGAGLALGATAIGIGALVVSGWVFKRVFRDVWADVSDSLGEMPWRGETDDD